MWSSRTILLLTLIFKTVSLEGLKAKVSQNRGKAQPTEVWIFKYPYAADGSCQCQQSQVGSYTNFTSENECLTAFRDNVYETCSLEEGGVTEEQCGNAVAIASVATNLECASQCTKVISDNSLTAKDFFSTCNIETPVAFGESYSLLGSSCFNNYVYGWGDFDPHNLIQAPPLQIFHGVSTAAKCQGLCQQTQECVAFTWRGFDDDEDASHLLFERSLYAFQNPAKTCLLFDKSYMDGVLHTPIDSTEILSGPSKYCNLAKVQDCLVNIGDFRTFNPFEDHPCLICGCEPRCVWLSGKHVSGPAHCTPNKPDLCSFPLPPPPTPMPTLPPPTSPTNLPGAVCPEACVDNCEEYIDDCFPEC